MEQETEQQQKKNSSELSMMFLLSPASWDSWDPFIRFDFAGGFYDFDDGFYRKTLDDESSIALDNWTVL